MLVAQALKLFPTASRRPRASLLVVGVDYRSLGTRLACSVRRLQQPPGTRPKSVMALRLFPTALRRLGASLVVVDVDRKDLGAGVAYGYRPFECGAVAGDARP